MINQVLYQLRKSQGLTQLELANLLGISKPHVCELEKGKKDPTWKMLQKYCSVFGIPISSIAYRAESFFRQSQ